MDHLLSLYHLNHLLINHHRDKLQDVPYGNVIKNRLIRSNLHKIIYAFTCGHHQQNVHAKKLTKNHQRLKYKKWKHKISEGGYSALNKMSLEHKIRTVDNLMKSPLDKFISLDVNYWCCEVTTNEFIVKWVNPLLLKDHSEASKEDKPNWNQAINGPFAYE